MCHHVIFAAAAITTIITAIIVREKQHRICQNNQQLPPNNTFVFAQCQQLQSSLLIWNQLNFLFFFPPTTVTDIWNVKAARHCHCWSFWKDVCDANITIFTSTWASAAARTHRPTRGPVHGGGDGDGGGRGWAASVEWQIKGEGTWAGRSRGCQTTSSLCPGSLLYWGATLRLENGCLMTRISPAEVPLRKTLNPQQVQAAGVLLCNCASVPWLPFGTEWKETFSTRCYRVNKTTKTKGNLQ